MPFRITLKDPIRITLKDPDGVHDSIKSAAESSTNDIKGLDDREVKQLVESRFARLQERCKPWIRDGEYITIEIDTEARTATVCKA